MRALAIGAAAAALLASGAGLAPGARAAPAPANEAAKTFVSDAEVQALIETAKQKRTTEANYLQRLLHLAPYNANLEYRAAVGPAAVHEHEAELFVVVEGSAVLTTGGTLVDEKRTDANNLSGSGIKGGFERRVSKGDMLIVPEKTPHWFSEIPDGPVVVMTLHVPRG